MSNLRKTVIKWSNLLKRGFNKTDFFRENNLSKSNK